MLLLSERDREVLLRCKAGRCDPSLVTSRSGEGTCDRVVEWLLLTRPDREGVGSEDPDLEVL